MRGKLRVIGNGVVVDKKNLVEEVEKMRGKGIDVKKDVMRVEEKEKIII